MSITRGPEGDANRIKHEVGCKHMVRVPVAVQGVSELLGWLCADCLEQLDADVVPDTYRWTPPERITGE